MGKRGLGSEDLDFSKLDPGLSQDGEISEDAGGDSFLDKFKPKVQHLISRFLSVLKLVLGLCFLTFVYTGSVGFLQELKQADSRLQYDFWSGVITFVVVYLFIWEPAVVYSKGHKILELIFNFF